MWSSEGSPEQPNPIQVSGGMVAAPGAAQYAGYPPPGIPVQQHPQAELILPPTPIDNGSDVPASLVERIRMCEFLADANLLPQSLRKQPANLLLIMQKAVAMSVSMSVAIEHFHVIDGKVGYSAELLRALLYRNGHLLRWITMTDKEVSGELTLRHDPRNPRVEKFTIADAARMELTGKTNWKKDPISMLVARCTTRLISRHCPEVAVALGNLSAMDFDDEPAAPEPVHATVEVDTTAQALAMLAEAWDTEDPVKLKAIGTDARAKGLLDVKIVVEGAEDTFQNALLKHINDVKANLAASK